MEQTNLDYADNNSSQKTVGIKSYNRTRLRRLSMAAIMGAIAFILMYFNVGVPVLSPFAELDLSALPELIGGFILGPAGAIEIIVVKIALILVLKGTSSALTGEMQNLILSICYVLPAVIYYRRNKSKKSAVIGLVLGSVISVVVSIFTNVYLIFPAYIKIYGMNWDAIIEVYTKVNPWIKNIPTVVAFSVVPFNMVSRAITTIITVLVYKKLSVPLKKFIQ